VYKFNIRYSDEFKKFMDIEVLMSCQTDSVMNIAHKLQYMNENTLLKNPVKTAAFSPPNVCVGTLGVPLLR